MYRGGCFESQQSLSLALLFLVAFLQEERFLLFESLSFGDAQLMLTFLGTQFIFTLCCFLSDRVLALEPSQIGEPRSDEAATESKHTACSQQSDLSGESRTITHAPHHTGHPLGRIEVQS